MVEFVAVPQGAPLPHLLVRLLGPPVARIGTAQVSDDWIHVEETDAGFDVSVETRTTATGTLTLRGPTGGATLPVTITVVPTPAEPPTTAEKPTAVNPPVVEEVVAEETSAVVEPAVVVEKPAVVDPPVVDEVAADEKPAAKEPPVVAGEGAVRGPGVVRREAPGGADRGCDAFGWSAGVPGGSAGACGGLCRSSS